MKPFTTEEIEFIRNAASELGFALYGAGLLQTIVNHTRDPDFAAFANLMILAGYKVESYSNGHLISKP